MCVLCLCTCLLVYSWYKNIYLVVCAGMHRKAGQDVVNRSRRHYNNGESPSSCEEFSSSCSNDDSVPAPDPLIITRRNYLVGHLLTQKKRHAAARGGKRDIASLQEMWLSHCRQAASFYTPSMWRVLHAVKNEAKTTQSAVLSACRRMLPARQRHL